MSGRPVKSENLTVTGASRFGEQAGRGERARLGRRRERALEDDALGVNGAGVVLPKAE